MSLVGSLLGAIVRLDGDSLVLHVGEKPYVVTASASMNALRGPLAWGQVELSTRVLTADALNNLLEQLLTVDQRHTLDDIGAVERDLPATDELPAFTVIAARGGDDIWLEVRPVRPKPAAALEPEAEPEVEPEAEPEPVPPPAPIAEPISAPMAQPIPATEPSPVEAPTPAASFEIVPEVEQAEPDDAEVMQLLSSAGLLDHGAHEIAITPEGDQGDQTVAVEWAPSENEEEFAEAGEATDLPFDIDVVGAEVEHAPEAPALAAEAAPEPVTEAAPQPVPEAVLASHLHLVVPEAQAEAAITAPGPQGQAAVAPTEAAPAEAVAAQAAGIAESETREPEPERPAAVVVTMSRPPLEAVFSSSSSAPVSAPSLDRLLRLAAARGASGLYLTASSQPVIRVDGEMQQLGDEESLTPADVEAFMLALAPEPSREAVRTGATSEWFRDIPGIGRVRCLSFADHRGPGVVIRMLPARAISVEQLGLSKELQALCAQPEGLVLITGPRASGGSTLVAAFVDLVNRSRADHVVTIERQISFVHESRRSFVSQREVRGESDELAAAVRAALREDPDVLVIEQLRSAEVAAAAIEAAESGRLVFAGLRAPATVSALERLVEQFPAERRPHILTSLAASLRAVVGQVLLRKRGGGRVAARELLLNTPAAAALIAEGKLFQLPAALESGRKLGSVALNDALAALIRDGVVDAGEAWRKAYDREGLLTALKREGIDTSFVERLA
jgi:twitching motility protein PilT